MVVHNNSSHAVHVKPENSRDVHVLQPGRTYSGAQDGIAIRSRPGFVFKSVNGINITVTDSSANYGVRTSGGIIPTVGQWIRGGWKGASFTSRHTDWNDLRIKRFPK